MEIDGPKGGILRRAARNAGLLLTGKSAAGVMQLCTFALAARALGVTDFGIFSVVVAQVMLLTGIAAFDSNQAIIRYGVRHLGTGDRHAIQDLFKAGSMLDLIAASAACLATILIAPIMAGWLGWGPELVLIAQAAAPLAFSNAVSTSKGMLRLLGRFDLLSVHAIVTPGARLLFVAGLSLVGAELPAYVAAWVVAGLIGTVVAAVLAWREAHRKDLLTGLNRSLRRLSDRNPGVWGFSILSNLNSSVSLIPTQLAVIIVGGVLGAAAAGVFRIAREAGTGLIKPLDLVSQALYPDLARLASGRAWDRLLRTAIRAGLSAAGAGIVVTLLVFLVGPTLVDKIFGHAFLPAAPLLVAVAAGTSIRVLAFAAEPVLYALGKPQLPLLVSVASAALFVLVLVWRLPQDGLLGAVPAFLVLGASGAILSGTVAVRLILRERTRTRQAGAE